MLKLMERHLLGAEFARQSFRATPPAGVALADLLTPEYWVNVGGKFNPTDIVEVVPEDGAFYARLIVINNGKLWVKMHTLEYVELNPVAKPKSIEESAFEAKWFGPNGKWKAISKVGAQPISNDSFQTREEAETYITNHIKTLAA